MVYKKAAPKRKMPSSKTVWAAKNVYKRPAIRQNYRTGGYVGLESKFLDTFHSKGLGSILNGLSPNIDPSGGLCLNAVPLGTGESSRQGRRIWMETLDLNFKILNLNPDLPFESSQMVRIWVIKDKQTNESQLAAEDALVDMATVHTINQKYNILTNPNLQWKDRFEILYDNTFNLNASAYKSAEIPAFASIVRGVQVKLKINCPVTFDTDGTGGTIATITDNSIHVLAVSSEEVADMQLRYVARLRFRDQ